MSTLLLVLAAISLLDSTSMLPICIKALIEPGHLSWPELIAKLTIGPATVLGIQKGTLAVGADADITLIDPNLEWTIDASTFRSNSRNTPFDGWNVRGRAHTVILAGQVKYQLHRD